MSYFSMKQLQHWMKQPSIYSTKQLNKERLPEMIILSVGHRSTLQRFHNKQLKLDVCLLCEN